MFIPIAELIIPAETETNKENAEIETQLVIIEDKISKLSNKLHTYMSFYIFHSLNHCIIFRLKDNFLFYQCFLI